MALDSQPEQIFLPPPIVVTQPGSGTLAVSNYQGETVRPAEPWKAQGGQAAPVLGHGHVRPSRSRSGRRTASRWRNPQSVRQAFVASLIFAPPKSSEL